MVLGAFFAIFLCFFLSVVYWENPDAVRKYLGLAQIFVGGFGVAAVYWLFLGYLQNDRGMVSFSLAGALSAGSDRRQVLRPREFFSHLFTTRGFLWVLRRLGISSEEFRQQVYENYSIDREYDTAAILREAADEKIFTLYDFLLALYRSDKTFQELIFSFELREDDFRHAVLWRKRLDDRERGSKFWLRENLLNTQGIGKSWAGGFTVNLDRVATDLTAVERFRKTARHLYGHRKNLELLEQQLVSTGNAVLVGGTGSGRHTLLRALAARINTGHVLGPLRYQRLLQIDSMSVLSGAPGLNDVVDHIRLLFGEALAAGNVILLINDFDAFLDPRPEAGRVNATEAILPFLQSRLPIIGITTPQGYQNTIGKNSQLERYLPKLEIAEPTDEETLMILEDEVRHYESSDAYFTCQALSEIVRLSSKLIKSLPNPEKSLEIMEAAALYALTKTSDRQIRPAHVQRVVSERTKIPVEKVEGVEKDVLLNLENILHERIVGQKEAVSEVAAALRRARSGIRSEKKPIGSFLFLGPTGVGKTETTKALAAVYFGSEQRIIRLDMSEFQEVHSINRVIGDADAGTGGLLTDQVITDPFSLVLLDEIEKAHPKILDLLLQVLDEGRLTDALGRVVDFTNTMIIATSNAGAEQIRTLVREGTDLAAQRDQILNLLQQQGQFRPEFLNRFDAVVIFHPLNMEEQTQVASLLLRDLNARLAEKEIQIKITPELAAAVAAGGYHPEYGARPLRRFIQEKIENYVATGLLSGDIKRGQTVAISPEILSK